MAFNVTFNNISAISWRSVLLVEAAVSVKKVNEDDICRSNRILLYKKQDKVRGDVPQNMFLSC
jgi:hypothetical protein